MAYTATYESADYDDIIFDLAGTVVAEVTSNASLLVTLIVLGMIVVLMRKTIKGSIGLIGGMKM